MPVIDDIREQQKKAMKEMPLKGKLAYFWDYYKIHTLVGILIIIFAVSIIYSFVTSKDYIFYAAFINAAQVDVQTAEDSTETRWANEFAEYAQIDTEEYQAYVDTSFLLQDATSQYGIANQQKLVTLMQTGTITVFAADSEAFDNYAQSGYFQNLEEFLPADAVEKYRDLFYYTDASVYEESDDEDLETMEANQAKYYNQVIDHRNPDAFDTPVAVGICINDMPKIAEAGFYTYLTEQKYTFHGHQSEAVLGIPLTVDDPGLTLLFLEYLEN